MEDGAVVMELVEGHDLHGPLPLATALNYAAQIASALDAAHEKGIVHRDLKPANIRITSAGVVKLLDFGLAKAPPRDDSGNVLSPSLPTRPGFLLGTAAYMSPEQARGQTVDKRADIWAFGVVLFEMLTGEKLFGGANVSDSLAAVLTREPDFGALPRDTPLHVRRLLERCLRKDPKSRLRDIGDASILTDQTSPDAPVPRNLWICTEYDGKSLGLLLHRAQVLWACVWHPPGLAGKAADDRTTRFLVPLPEKSAFGTYDQPVLSPDGKRIVFSARYDKPGFFVHSLGTTGNHGIFQDPKNLFPPSGRPTAQLLIAFPSATGL